MGSKNKLKKFNENLNFQNLFQPNRDDILNSNFKFKGRWNDYFENSNPIINQSRFRDNQALIEGAGIYIYGGNLQLEWSSFENNIGNDFGGGLVGNQSMININQTTFTGNV